MFQLLDDFDTMQLDIDLVYRLASFHSGHIHLSEYDIGRVFFHIGESFRQFAVKQPTFQVGETKSPLVVTLTRKTPASELGKSSKIQ